MKRPHRTDNGESIALRLAAMPVVALGGIWLVIRAVEAGHVIGAAVTVAITFALLVVLFQASEGQARPLMWLLRPVKWLLSAFEACVEWLIRLR